MVYIQKRVFQKVGRRNIWKCYILLLHLPGALASVWRGILDTTLKSILPHPPITSSSSHTQFNTPEALKAFPLVPLLSPTFLNTPQFYPLLSIHGHFPSLRHEHLSPWSLLTLLIMQFLLHHQAALHTSQTGLWQPKWDCGTSLHKALLYNMLYIEPQLWSYLTL